ncbi:MAG TPA: hypothetical protein VKX17_11065 [Planctomycetota bacterium]|nr:hypothetical protein [Planctomycetota bacterium]
MPKANDDMEVAYHWLKAETSVSYASAWYLGLESAILALSEAPLRFPVAQEFQKKKVDSGGTAVFVRQQAFGVPHFVSGR